MEQNESDLQILELAKLHLHLMRRIADAMESLASDAAKGSLPLRDRATTVKAPNYTRPLEQWSGFDWQAIGATVEQTDYHGVALVSWHGQLFARRAPSNKYDPAVWYSRCVGKDERGENQYERLITFKPLAQAEPVPERVSRLVR